MTRPSWTTSSPDRSRGAASPRFSRHRRWSAFSSLPMIVRASEPPMNWRRSTCATSREMRSILGIAPPFTELVLFLVCSLLNLTYADTKGIYTRRSQMRY